MMLPSGEAQLSEVLTRRNRLLVHETLQDSSVPRRRVRQANILGKLVETSSLAWSLTSMHARMPLPSATLGQRLPVRRG